MIAITGEMMHAAWEADYAWAKSTTRERGGSWGSVPEAQLRRLLEAAAPLIAAAERDRIRHLAITHEATYLTRGHRYNGHRAFAELLEQP
jgi:hypothetical protein